MHVLKIIKMFLKLSGVTPEGRIWPSNGYMNNRQSKEFNNYILISTGLVSLTNKFKRLYYIDKVTENKYLLKNFFIKYSIKEAGIIIPSWLNDS